MKRQHVCYIALPFVLIALLLLLKNVVAACISSLWPCVFYRVLHVYCPGCGMSRSILSLLNGDLVASLRFNVCPVLAIIFAAIGYAEWGTAVFGSHRRLLPRSVWFWVIFGVLMAAYFLLRNVVDFMPVSVS